MIFSEKVPHKWHFWNRWFTYEVTDLFGKIVYKSKKRLDAKKLDMLTMAIMKLSSGKGEVGKIRYEYTRQPMWEDDEEDQDEEQNSQSGSGDQQGSSQGAENSHPLG